MRVSKATNAAVVFKALGDSHRLRLVQRLTKGTPLSITSLSAGSEISRQAVTKHLHVLQKAGVVRPLRSGREQQFEICPDSIVAARDYLEAIGREWESALARLKAFVE